MHTRSTRSASRRSSGASGSEYHASEKSVDMEDPPLPEEEPKEETPEITLTRSGRPVRKQTYVESSDADGDDELPVAADLFDDTKVRRVTRSSRQQNSADAEDEDEDGPPGRYRLRKKPPLDGFIVVDEDDEMHGGYATRTRTKRLATKGNGGAPKLSQKERQEMQRLQRHQKRSAQRGESQVGNEDFQPDHTSSAGSADADGSLDDAPHTSSDLEPLPEPEPEPEPEDEGDGKPYSLRQRKEVNYAIPPPLEDLPKPPPRQGGGRNGRNGGGGANSKGKGRLGWSASGAELGRWMGMPAAGDDSDSDYPTRTPRKGFGGIAPYGAGAMAGGGMLGGDLAAGGTPSNLGKIGDSALADADPLGVNQNVTFDEVGGLDDHIHALKEMTLLPLLYPEVFQRFNVTPPRGVLFHGPPGTGKTLLARALAASCRTGGRQISFFMRKGADCLSKWVGEAERQLRLLFEEARNSQPSIIFFDEIDGLAPVRSSKQDQIHASIVSTLLALMDGMDGRGQVVVIGATNRPDAVDPALRRPGRFDREFYFGLPGLEAREKILSIMTRKWEGWGGDRDGEEEKSEEKEKEVKERIKGLAKLTKGYGGADLRALCTEAALNAIQRRYPQVYKSNDRLLLKPETIGVGLRDFMISIKKLVPSSARSSSSAATPLPIQFVPLLEGTLEKVKQVVHRVMPVEKKLSALEEAEFEDEGGEEGALEKEMFSQAMQTLRVYRPRVIIHGPIGMGQGYIGAAALHHLEGYHVQSLELGTLMSDSTRTVEAAIVQLFIEAKRNQPSVIYIPSLVGWCAAVSETSRSTVRAMLDTLAPTDPILLLAVVDGRFSDLPRDVKAWFGPTKDNRVELPAPTVSQREAFFAGLVKDVQRPPNKFSDGMERRKRVLEELPIAPPLEPRKPTPAELALQEETDIRVLTLLKYRLGPILTELKRKFKRFTKRASEEYNFDFQEGAQNGLDTVTTAAFEIHTQRNGPNGIIDITGDMSPIGHDGAAMNGIIEQQQIMQQAPPLFDMDLERMQTDLFKGRYLTPQDFLEDVYKMVHNAEIRAHEDQERLHKAQAMYTAAEVSIQELEPQLKLDCDRMAPRERQRREERRREKEKRKAKEVNGMVPPVGARRSARANGLQPELTLTDPVKLERRLKRQRGEDVSDSHGSEAEAHAMTGVNGGRDAKRSRLVDEYDDDRDPLDTLASSRPGTATRHPVVRFATQIIEPMAPLMEVPQHQQQQHPYQHQPDHLPPHPFSHQSPYQPPHYYQQPQGQHFSDQMVVDEYPPRRVAGFNPALLNPILPSPNFPGAPFAPPPQPNNGPFHFPTSSDPSDPFHSQPHPQFHSQHVPQHNNPPPMSMLQLLARTPTPPPFSQLQSVIQQEQVLPPPPPPQPPSLPERFPTPLPEASTSSSSAVVLPEPTPMVVVVERSPTPPLPEFHVSQFLLSELCQLLKDRTGGLSVEQLEQLRATSLGTVWRHRKEWNRDALVEELLKDAKEFIEEVGESEFDDE
ncbi:hypothetical protein M413DRAFT_70190 [Hebeloma cylindrosporum]|uniref:AAA+ ATPase domain-containing protein n=1 Tax=Hebeloma cylindrosporum TaxID=76867 RepID=A0A0C2YNS9_HEBCY|nr:hypothetical protein M413DRAFT_70190 [Hebeloma cylindrosporum h7]